IQRSIVEACGQLYIMHMQRRQLDLAVEALAKAAEMAKVAPLDVPPEQRTDELDKRVAEMLTAREKELATRRGELEKRKARFTVQAEKDPPALRALKANQTGLVRESIQILVDNPEVLRDPSLASLLVNQYLSLGRTQDAQAVLDSMPENLPGPQKRLLDRVRI